jgi:hypothetical protein
MRELLAIGVLAAALLAAGCGGSEEPDRKAKKEETMKVEDTAFGPLVGTPKQVQDRTDAAAQQYRERLNERLDQDEGASGKDEPAGD